MVEGSTRKLFKQKHTGNARRGPIRTNVMKGGGVAFGKKNRDFRKDMPKKMRRAALDSAILAKILGQDMLVVDGLKIDKPKTAAMSKVLKNLSINRSCLLTVNGHDKNVYLSARNIPGVAVQKTADLNAFDVATRQKMLITSDAIKSLIERAGK